MHISTVSHAGSQLLSNQIKSLYLRSFATYVLQCKIAPIDIHTHTGLSKHSNTILKLMLTLFYVHT